MCRVWPGSGVIRDGVLVAHLSADLQGSLVNLINVAAMMRPFHQGSAATTRAGNCRQRFDVHAVFMAAKEQASERTSLAMSDPQRVRGCYRLRLMTICRSFVHLSVWGIESVRARTQDSGSRNRADPVRRNVKRGPDLRESLPERGGRRCSTPSFLHFKVLGAVSASSNGDGRAVRI